MIFKFPEGLRQSHTCFFADDSLLFAHTNVQECLILTEINQWYESASGIKFNLSKSVVCFSKHVWSSTKHEIISCLKVKEVDRHSKYLGLPTFIRRPKKTVFVGIKERM